MRSLRDQYPGVPVISYVNTSAAVKAESNICGFRVAGTCFGAAVSGWRFQGGWHVFWRRRPVDNTMAGLALECGGRTHLSQESNGPLLRGRHRSGCRRLSWVGFPYVGRTRGVSRGNVSTVDLSVPLLVPSASECCGPCALVHRIEFSCSSVRLVGGQEFCREFSRNQRAKIGFPS